MLLEQDRFLAEMHQQQGSYEEHLFRSSFLHDPEVDQEVYLDITSQEECCCFKSVRARISLVLEARDANGGNYTRVPYDLLNDHVKTIVKTTAARMYEFVTQNVLPLFRDYLVSFSTAQPDGEIITAVLLRESIVFVSVCDTTHYTDLIDEFQVGTYACAEMDVKFFNMFHTDFRNSNLYLDNYKPKHVGGMWHVLSVNSDNDGQSRRNDTWRALRVGDAITHQDLCNLVRRRAVDIMYVPTPPVYNE